MKYPFRLGGRLRLFRVGPFSMSLYKTFGKFGGRKRVTTYHGTYPGGWGGAGHCPHNHRRPDTARACADAEGRRLAAL